LLNLPNWPEAIKIFNEEMMNLHRGQGMELYWRDTCQPPSEEDYLQMISNKTGGLFRLIVRLLQAASPVNIEVSKLVDVMGLIFQILDDLKNVCDEKVCLNTTLVLLRPQLICILDGCPEGILR
jgi:geranylgeranyl diphosphate synthase type 3